MKFSVITLFPDLMSEVAKVGVVGQAVMDGKISLEVKSPRAWTTDVHKTIDDRPFGGGDGMVLMSEPISQCLGELLAAEVTLTKPRCIYLSPQGKKLDHNLVMELSQEKHLILLCGRYAGVDQRVLNHYEFEEVSIGDYVLSGGELGALVLIDTIGRQLEGVLGHAESSREDSFAKEGLLEAPCFTRPREWKDWVVPDFLLSGNHSQIAEDRWILSVLITFKKRPDLFDAYISKQVVMKKKWLKAVDRVSGFAAKELISLGLEASVIESFKKELSRLKII
jgi:tRNA (guanine37-N1)-methyltransferase